MKFSHRAIIYPQKNNDSILRHIAKLVSETKKPLEIHVCEYKEKRSGQQLRTWWRLISELTLFFNSHDNRFTKEQVSDYFKIKAGFCYEMDGIKLPRSLSNKGDATLKEASNLLEILLQFGAENGVELEITDQETQNFINYWNLKC